MPYRDPQTKKEYQRIWIAARRKEFFTGKSCVQCGNPDQLELDHIDPSLKVSHRIWSYSKTKREAEIAKCQVLCYACHLEKTRAMMKKYFDHGSEGRYKRGCRCQPCRDAHAESMRKWRESRLPTLAKAA